MISSSTTPSVAGGAIALVACILVSCDTPQKRAMRELAETGVEISGRSLVRAVETNQNARTALLLEAHVFTEQRDASGRTPLGIAVEAGDRSTAMMLLNANANVNATHKNGSSILGIAVEREDAVMSSILLASGARMDGLMPDGDKMLPWAIRKGRSDLVKTLMQADSDPHMKDRHGNPLLHIAMESGRRDLMETLIQLGADPGATNPADETTIDLALRQGWMDVIPKLAAAGADLNAPGSDGLTLLERALAAKNFPRIELFLKSGADPNLHSPSESSSPLQKAFDHPSPELLEIFLDSHAKPPQGQWSAWLWQTLYHCDEQKSRLLLAHGARPSHPDPHGYSLIETAALAGKTNFVKLLLDFNIPTDRSLYFATLQGNDGMVDLLLACGVSPNFTCFPTLDTPLAAAIRLKQDRIAELLLRHGASSNLRLPEGQSLFHLAVVTGCPRTVKHLLDSGTDPNSPFTLPVSPAFLHHVRPGAMRWVLKMDRNGTPLMAAADSGNVQTVRYLMKAGAKVNVRTLISKIWPINFASNRGDVPMMRLFLGRDPHHEERFIEIRISEQRARVFDAAGAEIFTTPVSTGKRGYSTRRGEFVITNKHREWKSTLYHANMPYFQRLSCGDFGLHQGVVPGYPASHGCIRVPSGKATKLFELTQTGDRVRIID